MVRITGLATIPIALFLLAVISLRAQPFVPQAARLALTPTGGVAVAGVWLSITVTAYDASDNVDASYAGTVHFTSSDGGAVLPADYTFQPSDNGTHTFINAVVLFASGHQTVAVGDGGLTSEATWTVNSAPASRLEVTGPPAVTAGDTNDLTVTARDAYGNIDSSYSGSKLLFFYGLVPAAGGQAPTVEDMPLAVAVPVTFTAGVSDPGVATLAAYAAESATVDVSDGTIGSSGSPDYDLDLRVTAASAIGVDLTPDGGLAASQSPFLVTVTARDAYGNTATGYRGMVRFSSSDVDASLPSDYVFSAPDNGVHLFAIVLRSPGDQTVTVIDSASPSLTDSTVWSVSATAIDHYTLASGSYAQAAGTPFMVTVTAIDAFGSVVTEDNETAVTLSSTSDTLLFDGDADGTFGEASDNVVVLSSGTFTVAARDTLAGTSATIVARDNLSRQGISPTYTFGTGATHHYTVTSLSLTHTAGEVFAVTVTAYDLFDNFVSTDNASWAILTSTSSTMLFDGNGNEVFGEVEDNVIRLQSGSSELPATDTVAGTAISITAAGPNSITGTSAPYTILAGPPDYYLVASDSYSQTAGIPFGVTVTAFDAYGNVAVPIPSSTVVMTADSGTMLLDGNGNGTFGEPGDEVVATQANPFVVSALQTVAISSTTITATDSSLRTGTSIPYIVGASTEVQRYTVTSEAYAQEVSVSFAVTVTAYDAYDNPVPADNIVVTMSSSPATLTFDGDGDGLYGEEADDRVVMTAGTFDVSAKPHSPSDSLVVTATDANGATGTSEPYTVDDFRCFIATAAYGTPMSDRIEVLRDFRDEYLMKNPATRVLVRAYYHCSPPVARFISRHDWLRAVSRWILTPIIWLASLSLKTTPPQKMLALLSLVIAIVTTALLWKRRSRSA